MKIDATREGGSALLRLDGRLDREWAEHLSDTLEELLQAGVRSVNIDCSRVTYASSAAPRLLARWQQELTLLRGDVQLTSLPPAVREVFTAAGWEAGVETETNGLRSADLRRSSWHARKDFAASGMYEVSAANQGGELTCHLRGDPARMSQLRLGPGDCRSVAFPEGSFGLGVGAIGRTFEECEGRFGELVAVAGCIMYYPTDGARMADYLVGGGPDAVVPRAVLATGLSCEGRFSQMVRFSTRPEEEAIPLSELAATALDAAGGKIAGVVIAGETAGLAGVRLRRSPADPAAPLRFDVPAVRDWLLFAPERTHAMTTTVIAGVVARSPSSDLAAHLGSLGGMGRVFGHFHAAVFSYHPLPQRTVELPALLGGLLANQELRDVLHLVSDDRGGDGVGESTLARGVAWVAPITQIC
jgi:anti-anti-sigma factor